MDFYNTDGKGLAYLRSEDEFDQARRKAFIQTMMAHIRGNNLDLLSFDEVVEKLKLTHTVELGLMDVPLTQIAGSCGRYVDFTRTFLPRSGGRDKERWRQIYTLAVTGQGFPPIDVYKIDQVYFVKDGNHRVSVARELGWQSIQAQVTELPTVFSLTPDVQPDTLLIKAECALFLERSQLHVLRPEADVVFTVPGRYRRLLNQISIHRHFISKTRHFQPSYAETVVDWYDTAYEPAINHIKESGIMRLFPKRTPDDLLAWLIEHQQALQLKHGLNPEGHIERMSDFLNEVSALSVWSVTRAEVEDVLKQLLRKRIPTSSKNSD